MQRLVVYAAIAVIFAASFIIGPAGPGTARLTAQSSSSVVPEMRWLRALDAWNAGHYPAALEDLLVLMRSAAAADYRERVALLTGGFFPTTELTADGRNPRLSANGGYASYESGPLRDPVTRILRLTEEGAEQIAEAHATGLMFSPDGTRAVWLRAPRSAEWTTAQALAASSTATAQERAMGVAEVEWLRTKFGEIVIRDLATNAEQMVDSGGLLKSSLAWSADGQSILFVGADEQDLTRSDIYLSPTGARPERLTELAGHKAGIIVHPSGAALMYSATDTPAFSGPPSRIAPPASSPPAPAAPGGPSTGIVNLAAKTTRLVSGSGVRMSADGSTLVWLARAGDTNTIYKSSTFADQPTTVRTGRQRLEAPTLSPDGRLVAYQLMSGIGSNTDWEIYVSDAKGVHRRVTREIQHDVLPRFLTNGTLIGMIGEPRHRRSRLYDIATGTQRRLFANDTIRTISPEYSWVPSDDGQHLAIVADRDGDAISAERGVYVVDLTRTIGVPDLVRRLERQLAAETTLRLRMTQAYRPIADLVRQVVGRASPHRVFDYARTLVSFDSKYRTEPGNLRAIEYLERTYRSFGYAPELQWFTPGGRQGGAGGGAAAPGAGTANVIATLRGTANPELIYVLGSHFDSVIGSPGADDNTSGTAALLEAARILVDTPLPATIVFASFTGEEGGLLGSREFVRLAQERKWRVVGALNNDMIGWAGESARLDNTIRYASAGIRDIQHGAAFLFTNLITYDSKYYRGTDATSFVDAWGEIVGGIGSYPILANPNYHQSSDVLETINMQQVMETAKVSVASLVYLASSPSRVTGVRLAPATTGLEVTWDPSPESGVRAYIVAHGPAADPLSRRITVTQPKAVLPRLAPGTRISVKAVNARGLEGWDWASATVE